MFALSGLHCYLATRGMCACAHGTVGGARVFPVVHSLQSDLDTTATHVANHHFLIKLADSKIDPNRQELARDWSRLRNEDSISVFSVGRIDRRWMSDRRVQSCRVLDRLWQ